jgi:hypothetical protein
MVTPMKLTNIAISKANPTEKTQKLFDGEEGVEHMHL